MAYYTAFDVSLRSVSICIIDDEGSIQFEGQEEISALCYLKELLYPIA